MFRTLLVFAFWACYAVFAAVVGFPWTFLSGKIDFLYRISMWGAFTGVRVGGVKVEIQGLDTLDPAGTYVFMCNHVSNFDPPIVVPIIPRRTSVLVKKELFRIPVLGRAMRMGRLVPVDRANRKAAVASVRAAAEVIHEGINMTVFPEGTRSRDGRLLPFKKGPFYLALEAGAPVVPITILGTFEILPKGRSSIRPGTATVIFHPPISPAGFANKETLLAAVRAQIDSALPPERRAAAAPASTSSG